MLPRYCFDLPLLENWCVNKDSCKYSCIWLTSSIGIKVQKHTIIKKIYNLESVRIFLLPKKFNFIVSRIQVVLSIQLIKILLNQAFLDIFEPSQRTMSVLYICALSLGYANVIVFCELCHCTMSLYYVNVLCKRTLSMLNYVKYVLYHCTI